MKSLEQLIKEARENRACPEVMKIIDKFYKEGNYSEIWHIALFEYFFLLDKKIIEKEDLLELEHLANGIARQWYSNGQLEHQYCWKGGKIEGEEKWWHADGRLAYQCYWRDGKKEEEKSLRINKFQPISNIGEL